MADKKISELDAITGANTAATDVFVVVDTSTGQTKKITREELNNAIEQDVLSSIDIDTINGDFTVNGNINLGDNNKAIFGAGSDLQIYHNGTDSYIYDGGTGDLNIRGQSKVRLSNAVGANYFQGTNGAEARIYYNGSTKLATTSTGIDVTGTVTADGLTVEDSGGAVAQLKRNFAQYFDFNMNASSNNIDAYVGSDGKDVNFTIKGNHNGDLNLGTRDTTRLKVGDNGDISFYEDTGTTAKLFWDASAESLGIGTSSPATALDVTGTVTADGLSVSAASGAAISVANTGTVASVLMSVDSSVNSIYSRGVNSSTARDLRFMMGSTERMRIDSNGNVGINTVPTRLTSNAHTLNIKADVTSKGGVLLLESSDESLQSYFYPASAGTQLGTLTNHDLLLMTNSSERMRITSGGSVGIGTSSPLNKLDLAEAGDTQLRITSTDGNNVRLGLNSSGTVYNWIEANGTNLLFAVGNAERMRIDSSGNVGIGTTSPSYQTHIKGTGSAFRLGLESDGLITGQAFITDNSGSPVYASISSGLGNLTFAADTGNSYASSYMDFQIDGSEKARLDASGNLLVGTTDTTLYNNSGSGNGGIALSMPAAGAGRIDVARAGNCYTANRLASDGNFFEFFKDGTQVGSIGVEGGDNFYITDNNNTGLNMKSGLIIPCNTDGSTRDNAIDLGASGGRFNDLYLGGGVYVGGTGSANHLDDYEEGTFTPVLADATSGGNTASGTFYGSYTKVGRKVYCQLFLLNINTTGMTSSNLLYLRGMPFTSNSSDQGGRANAAIRCDHINFTGYVMAAYGPNSTIITFQDIIDSANDVGLTVASITSSGTSDMFFDITYQTN